MDTNFNSSLVKGNGEVKLSKYDRLYVELGFWKCADSPTKAHHWIETDSKDGLFQCKWCEEERRFNKNWNQVLEDNEPKRMAKLLLTGKSSQRFLVNFARVRGQNEI